MKTGYPTTTQSFQELHTCRVPSSGQVRPAFIAQQLSPGLLRPGVKDFKRDAPVLHSLIRGIKLKPFHKKY